MSWWRKTVPAVGVTALVGLAAVELVPLTIATVAGAALVVMAARMGAEDDQPAAAETQSEAAAEEPPMAA